MTNIQIVANAAIAENIFTMEQIENIFSSGHTLPLFTYKEWQRRGFQVKKGEKASLTCYIWRKKKDAPKDAEITENEEETAREFYKQKAFFFLPKQVEQKA